MKNYYRLAFLIVLQYLAADISGQYTFPDNSPSIENFYRMEMPSLEKDWTEEDYRAFFKLLKEIKGLDKYSLPRYGSKVSGEIFEKLMDPDYLDLEGKENIPTDSIFSLLEKLAAHTETLMDLYLEPRRSQGFGLESLISLEGMIHFIKVQYDLFDRIEQDYPNATSIREALIVEQTELIKAFLEMLSDDVINPEQQHRYLALRGNVLCELSSIIPKERKGPLYDEIELKASKDDNYNHFKPWLTCFNPED